jgi:pimeloyl-ACP methyl ester carboxylesterase
LGGLLSRLFAAAYLDEVAGVVLVDPRDVTQAGIYADEELAAYEEVTGFYGIAGRLGVLRWNGANTEPSDDLPPRRGPKLRPSACRTATRGGRGGSGSWATARRTPRPSCPTCPLPRRSWCPRQPDICGVGLLLD